MTEIRQDCRLDIWLWRARFFKTRTLAAKACESGHIRLIRTAGPVRVQKASQTVHRGEHLVFAQGSVLHDIKIIDFGERRGPAEEAQTLYQSQKPQS